jgi:deoxyribodipyrimidine photo-lyase
MIEQQLYNCEIGKDYPYPIVNVEETRKIASDTMWGFRKNDEVKMEGKRILAKHVHNSKPRTTKVKKQIKKTDD